MADTSPDGTTPAAGRDAPISVETGSVSIFQIVERRIRDAITALQRDGTLPAALTVKPFTVEPPRDPAHGDLATNVAMVLAKDAGVKPRSLADALVLKLVHAGEIEAAEVAGPGFINLRLAPALWQGAVATILAAGPAYGRSALGKGDLVNVEYVSANPTGPMHVGHCRGAVFGDALANLLAFAGYSVTREYYINDAGAQVDVLARSAFLRYREALGESITIPEGLYPGDYLKPVGAALAAEHGPSLLNFPEERWLPKVREVAIAAMMGMIREDLAALNIRHEVFFSERGLTRADGDQIATTIADLRARGLVFEGRLPPPKGEPDKDWEDREQTLFKSTAFGDDIDRALLKSDGSYTYFAADMAYHKSKWDRGFSHMIDVWGADHGGYIRRVRAAVSALTAGKADFDVKIVQLVRLFKNGEPFKMSKRAGTFVTLRDVVDEVGRDPVRFMMLYRKNDAPLDFDFAKVTEQSKENPVFYVQYAHARSHSLFRRAGETFAGLEPGKEEVANADLTLLTDAGEIALIKKLVQFPRLIEAAAAAHEPHRIAFYLYELASDLHAHWNRGQEAPHLRFIRDDCRKLTASRVALVAATAQVLSTGLSLLGVQAPSEMR